MTKEQQAGVRRLLAWQPRFAEGAPACGAWNGGRGEDGVLTLSFPSYAPEVEEFFAAVHEEFTEPEYLEKVQALGGLEQTPAWFRSADYESLRTLLFAISRGERFSDGLRLEHCENGTVRRALARLRELADRHQTRAR